MGRIRRRLVVSNASPLIHLALAGYLWVLPCLYRVMIPTSVYQETQHYADLPDAIEVARAAGRWLKVVSVRDRKRVDEMHAVGLGRGEAEAFALYSEVEAYALLLTDEDAMRKARARGFNAINLADIAREAFLKRLFTPQDAYQFADTMISQRILVTGYMRKLMEEAREWSSKPR